MSSLRLADESAQMALEAPLLSAIKPDRSFQDVPALVGEKLTLNAFQQLCGRLGGYPFVKVIADRSASQVHFINNALYPFHIDYVAEKMLGLNSEQMMQRLDELNKSVYQDADRGYLLGNVALHKRDDKRFFTLETVEVDTMGEALLREFYATVKTALDPAIPLLIKPANHGQEAFVTALDSVAYPRVFTHELFASASFIALNTGSANGRLRVFHNELEYRQAYVTIEWFDIICMPRVPDDVPRVSGIINTDYTTPLSHTNVLAHGWNIPNAIQLGLNTDITERALNGEWVDYSVDRNADTIRLTKTAKPDILPDKDPRGNIQTIRLETPETENTPIVLLDQLRATDGCRYGTKAANLGELRHVLENGSARLTGFYRIKRPPRANLLPYLAGFLGAPKGSALEQSAWEFLRTLVHIPKGIAVPFAVQQEFLQSSPLIQQTLGKLKMALELNVPDIDPLCYKLQQLVRETRLSTRLRTLIDDSIAEHLGGVTSFVIRSSSNAEDLQGFSAAGIYESINHVTTAENIFHSLKEVWASLLSARSMRLRHESGILLDDCYMGVIIQEEVPADMGGVLVSGNPTDPTDFRHVYINASARSVTNIVQGEEMPYQYLYNTVEGNGRTLSLGEAGEDLPASNREALRKLAFASRLLQSHFSPDYTFSQPLDLEWVCHQGAMHILQIRPYAR